MKRRPFYGWIVISIWLSSTLVGFIIVFNIGLLLPAITEDLGLSHWQQGVLASAAFWGSLFLTLPLGWWASRFSPKAVIGSTLAIGTLLILLQGWSPAFAVLLIGRMGFGLALIAMEPPGAALIEQWFPPHRIVFVNSISNAMFGFVMGLGLVATPLILSALDGEWRTVFYISGATYGVLTLIWIIFGKDGRPKGVKHPNQEQSGESTVTSTPLKETLMHRDLILASIGMAAACLAWSSFISFLPTFLLDRHGISLNLAGWLLATNMAVSGIAGVIAATLVSRSQLVNPILILLGITMTVGYLAMTLTGNIPLLFLFASISGLSGVYFPLLYSAGFQLRGVTPDRIPTAIAAIMTAIAFGTVLGPMLTGFLQDILGELRLPLIILSMAGLLLIPIGMFISLKPAIKPPEHTAKDELVKHTTR